MVLTASQGQCENWKKYFEDKNGKYFYDKDSIHYPQKKKSLFGLQVRNKEIFNVWVYCISKDKGEMPKYLLAINCATRKFHFSDTNMFDDLFWCYNPSPDNRIGPGDPLEGILKKVCP